LWEWTVALMATLLLGCSGAESFSGAVPDGATSLTGTGGAGSDGMGSGGAIVENSGGATGAGSGGVPDDSSGAAGGQTSTGGSSTGGSGTGGAGTGGDTADAATIDLGSSSGGAPGSGGAMGSGGAAGTGGAGASSPCAGVATWSAVQAPNYQAGDKTVDGTPSHLYRCKPYPSSGWCQLTGYEPADPSGYGKDAWDDLGPCN
jgi:hypothetical protein